MTIETATDIYYHVNDLLELRSSVKEAEFLIRELIDAYPDDERIGMLSNAYYYMSNTAIQYKEFMIREIKPIKEVCDKIPCSICNMNYILEFNDGSRKLVGNEVEIVELNCLSNTVIDENSKLVLDKRNLVKRKINTANSINSFVLVFEEENFYHLKKVKQVYEQRW
jgi:hypothetical protein